MTGRRSFLRSLGTGIAAPLFAPAAVPPLPAQSDPAYWSKIRDQFLLARDKVYFNNGTIGAMPKVVFERTVEHLRKMATDIADWDYRPGEEWIAGYGPFTAIRAKAAALLHCEASELALTENVTEAMNYLAAGLSVEPGSEILVTDQEHPGGQCPWLNVAARYRASVQMMRVPKPAGSPSEVMEAYYNALTPRTRILAISHMITGAGTILPVKQICAEARSRGVFTILDGAQAVGHIRVDLEDIGCDAYVGCFHKWILAPAGTGFLFVRKERAREVWTTLASSQWNHHQDEGYRLTQRGTGSLSLLMGLDAALDFHNSLGPERVYARIKYLGDYLREGLRKIPRMRIYTSSDPSMCAGITVYGVGNLTGQQLQDEMWKRARLRPRANGPGVRHCTHIFNSPQEIDRSLEVVRTLSAS
ncbi:MAG TPA: aminotransferase class V-fold PLP-dependent enzyme [Candidatus Acidoferrales bacterium]|nr:aminotransferase class V-fold PLP-dependent enzyme [Candidatus Acidoferrales bacterium]